MAPAHTTTSRWQQLVAWFGRRSTGQRALVLVWAAAAAFGLIRAQTWATRFVVVGLACLLLPVAWTLVPGRRR